MQQYSRPSRLPLYRSSRHPPTPRQMPRYCIVVKTANDGLFQALEEAFLGRSAFCVVRERRVRPATEPWPGDRRQARVWETGELLFSESPDE